MKNDKLFAKLVVKMHQVSVVPPQTVGPFTPLYKKISVQLKYFPFRALLPLSLFFILFAYLMLGTKLVKLAELLQTGF